VKLLKTLTDTHTGAMVAFPTHSLRKEFADRLVADYPEIWFHATLPSPVDTLDEIDRDEVIYLYSVKNFKMAGMHLTEAGKTNDAVQEYKKSYAKANQLSEGTILFTTHHQIGRFIEQYPDRLAIIDEDPINNILRTDKIQTKKVTDLVNIPHEKDKLYKSQFTTKSVDNTHVDDFLTCDYYESDGNYINYIKHNKFNLDKVTILSATASKEIYEKLEPNLIFKEIPYVKTIGSIEQYADATYSASYFNNNPKVFDKIREQFKNITLITHKKLNDNNNESNTSMHLRNAQGYDELKGKDIAVVGTSFPSPTRVKLISSVLNKGVLEGRLVNKMVNMKDGRRFKFFTYMNTVLNAVHMWEIESSLIQAIGRARILRTNAKVTVFSNLLLPNAKILATKEKPVFNKAA